MSLPEQHILVYEFLFWASDRKKCSVINWTLSKPCLDLLFQTYLMIRFVGRPKWIGF